MQRLMVTLFGLSACAVITAAPFSASAGEITRESQSYTFEWRSTECLKPVHYKSASETKQNSLQRYAAEISNYLKCLQNEAQKDHQKGALAIIKSRRGSTTSPINFVKRSSVTSAASTFTCKSERAFESSVVSQS